jgi:hypothetical protein
MEQRRQAMTPKALLRRLLDPLKERRFLRTKPAPAPRPPDAPLAVAVVAFNNPDLIFWQRRLLAERLEDPFDYVVVDNSTDAGAAERTGLFCAREGLRYVRVPVALAPRRDGSYSHGLALNWAVRHVLGAYGRVAFIDHDLFPVRRTSILKALGSSPFYGHIQRRGPRWYLWPGFAFFDLEKIGRGRLDFMPGKGLDTGGGNWASIFSRLDPAERPGPRHRYARLPDLLAAPPEDWEARTLQDPGEGEITRLVQGEELVEFIGDWMHLFNGSNWRGAPGKREAMETLLRKIAS